MIDTTVSWNINRTKNFSETEIIEIVLHKDRKGRYFILEDGKSLEYRKVPTWRFFLSRYPILAIPVLIISILFLLLYPLVFFAYVIMVIVLFATTVRRCKMHSIGTYIMIFWIIHLSIDFVLLGGGLVNISAVHHTIQGLLIGMMFTHLWIFVAIFFYRHYNVFNLVDCIDDSGIDGEREVVSTEWYLWRGCSLCSRHYIPFAKNCKEPL